MSGAKHGDHHRYNLTLTGPQMKSLLALLKQVESQSRSRNHLYPNKPHMRWTDNKRALLRAMMKKGLTVQAMADEFGLGLSQMYRRIAYEKAVARTEANKALARAVAPRPYAHPIYSATLHMKDQTDV